jgi:hypothetical protein
VREARRGEEGQGAGKLTERAEYDFGEAGELAEAQARTEENLRRRAAREGREYVPQHEPPAPRPELLEANEDAWELFTACSSQLILGGFGGAVGIRHDTLASKMDVREIPHNDRYELEMKFRHLEQLYVKRLNRDLDKKPAEK